MAIQTQDRRDELPALRNPITDAQTFIAVGIKQDYIIADY